MIAQNAAPVMLGSSALRGGLVGASSAGVPASGSRRSLTIGAFIAKGPDASTSVRHRNGGNLCYPDAVRYARSAETSKIVEGNGKPVGHCDLGGAHNEWEQQGSI